MEYRNGIAEATLYIYMMEPKQTTSIKDLERHDKTALSEIERLESCIEKLKTYRLELAERARELSAMERHTKVSLIRCNGFKGITYTLSTDTVYSDGTVENVDRKVYPGKERHEALKAFRKIKKDFPNYEFAEDIRLREWERR